jgi:maltodextrin utilization protein YvdJ
MASLPGTIALITIGFIAAASVFVAGMVYINPGLLFIFNLIIIDNIKRYGSVIYITTILIKNFFYNDKFKCF